MNEKKKLGSGAKIAIIAVVVIAVLAILAVLGNGKGTAQLPSGESSAENRQEAESAAPAENRAVEETPASQDTFDGATMSVTFKGIEDVPYLDGACNISLIAENRSDTPCTFAIDLQNATASGYGVTPIGGSLSVVQPGSKVILVYNLAYKQFGGASIDDLTDFTADIVQYRGESMVNADGSTTEIDRVHVSVEP